MLSRRPRDGKISDNGFSGEMLPANPPDGNIGSPSSNPFWQIVWTRWRAG
jgi:hypothetical protein